MKDVCPICSGILLRHISQKELTWFCSNCRQQMPNFNSPNIVEVESKVEPEIVTEKGSKPGRVMAYSQCYLSRSSQVAIKPLPLLELLIEEEKIRLDIVSFIITRTKSMINNALMISEKFSPESLEIILLHICHAILLQNSDLLKNQYLNCLKQASTSSNIVCQQKIHVINLIRDYVMNFVDYRTLDFMESSSKHNFAYLGSEIASYFDVLVECVIYSNPI